MHTGFFIIPTSHPLHFSPHRILPFFPSHLSFLKNMKIAIFAMVGVTNLSKVSDQIIQFLKNNPRYSYNAPTIQNKLKIANINTIRSELRRLNERGFISRETHGFYRIKLDSEVLYYLEHPPTLLHGIMVSMKTVRKLQNGIHGISADLDKYDFKKTSGPNDKRYFKKFYYENDSDRLITITIHFNGRIDVYINCSNHPVNYFEFRDILKYCEAKVDFVGPFTEQRVVEFGEAKDFRSVCMSGCNELSLRVFMNHWFRIYNKERLGVTRLEQHIKCDVPVSVLLDLFERMFLPMGNGFEQRPDERRDVV